MAVSTDVGNAPLDDLLLLKKSFGGHHYLGFYLYFCPAVLTKSLYRAR